MTKCPTCGSNDPARRFVRGSMAGTAISKDPWHGAHAPCPDAFHAVDSGDIGRAPGLTSDGSPSVQIPSGDGNPGAANRKGNGAGPSPTTKPYPRWLAEVLDAHAGLENGDPENGPTIESAILAGEIVDRLRRA